VGCGSQGLPAGKGDIGRRISLPANRWPLRRDMRASIRE
jgi:hypothetical protein